MASRVRSDHRCGFVISTHQTPVMTSPLGGVALAILFAGFGVVAIRRPFRFRDRIPSVVGHAAPVPGEFVRAVTINFEKQLRALAGRQIVRGSLAVAQVARRLAAAFARGPIAPADLAFRARDLAPTIFIVFFVVVLVPEDFVVMTDLFLVVTDADNLIPGQVPVCIQIAEVGSVEFAVGVPVLVPVLVFGNGNERPTAPVRLFEVHVAIGEERLGAVVVPQRVEAGGDAGVPLQQLAAGCGLIVIAFVNFRPQTEVRLAIAPGVALTILAFVAVTGPLTARVRCDHRSGFVVATGEAKVAAWCPDRGVGLAD